MKIVLVFFFATITCPYFSQIDDSLNDLKDTSESDYQKFDSIQAIPSGTLKAIRKGLPNGKRMPLFSYTEYLSSIQNIDHFLTKHTPRIFEYAFEYQNYIIIHYYLKVGPPRMPLIAVGRLNDSNKIDLLVFMRSWDFSSLDKFRNFKRVSKRTYSEEVPNRYSYY